jgi:hypothetical protein
MVGLFKKNLQAELRAIPESRKKTQKLNRPWNSITLPDRPA